MSVAVGGRLRRFVPRVVRHGASVQLARLHAGRLDRDLARLASGSHTIVAGPWLGEVGFELLYWVPFLRWFADRFAVAPERLLVVSRGGTASWYRPFAGGYREIFDYLTPDQFRRRHDERVAANGEQKQTQVLQFEHQLLRELTGDVHDRVMLHPSSMYSLFNPFWWGHVDESWVHHRARYARLQAADDALQSRTECVHRDEAGALRRGTAGVTQPSETAGATLPSSTASRDGFELPTAPYTAVKFYFNDCFPGTEANRAFLRRTLQDLLAKGPVVSLTTSLHLDDHGGDHAQPTGVRALPSEVDPRGNLALQTAIVAGAARFVGTYGGFSYLAPFLGVSATAYFSDAEGFSPRHLGMARSALQGLGAAHLLDVHATTTQGSLVQL